MKILKLLIVLCFVFPLSGCFGSEPNDIAYIVAMGFDKAQNETDYKITIQFAKPTQISGGASQEGGKGGPDIIENITVEAPNIYSGLNIANHVMSKKFSLFHTKLFVFSEDIARSGVGDLLETMARSEEIRPDIYIAVAIGEANKYLTEVKPVVELNPAKYYQLIYDKNETAGFPRSTLQDFYFLSNINYSDVAVPLAGVIKAGENKSGGQESSSSESQSGQQGQSSGGQGSSGEQQGQSSGGQGSSGEQQGQSSGGQDSSGGQKNKKNEKESQAPVNTEGFEYKTKDYIAGQVAVEKDNKAETMGMAIFRDKKMVGMLGSTESVAYNILKGEYKGSYITFYETENSDIPVTVKMSQYKKPLVKVDIDGQKLNVKLYLETDFYSLSSDSSLEENIAGFEEAAKKEIEKACVDFIKKTRDEFDTDVVAFGIIAKRQFLTNKDFDEYNWREKFKDYEINVEARVKVRRTGLKIKP